MGTIEPGRIDTLKPDSMFAIVDRAFANAGINIERRQGSNFCTKELILERPFRGSDFKNDQVLALTDTSIAESQMVPVIFIHNLISFTGSMYNGVTTDDGFNYKPYITLLVCVIKDGEIVYRDMITHNALTTRAPELDKAYQLPSAANVTQDGWDEHVRRVMKRYFKRMEGEALGRKDDYW
jgi:hypothetical protein